MTFLSKLAVAAKRFYVALMMGIIGRGLVAGSHVDKEFQHEIAGLPAGLTIRMTVMPTGPSFAVQVTDDHRLKLCKNLQGEGDLCIRFKHLFHAFIVFSFQEGTARAFANDRMYVDGNVGQAIRLVRCLNRMETLILPKFVAVRALKRYPDISLAAKLSGGMRLYGRMALNLLKGA